MSSNPGSRGSAWAAGLFVVVVSLILVPMGAWVRDALADSGGGAASTSVTPDIVSDMVAATAAEFRVDESGAATYSIPIYGVPGTAGVAPRISLNYSSQGGYGPLGKGWSIGGVSSISRCRATREAGDFIGAATPDGNPAPINFSATDRFCLDGARLLAVSNSPACPAASGMTAQQLRTEIESFQRVCAYTPSGGANGPAFFTVERKDGSISWYGDRDNNTTANRPDGYVETNAPGHTAKALTWAQTRFQDSTGNYIDYTYLENHGTAAGAAEHLIQEVRYTGKTVLSGQTGSALAPYAKIQFNYTSLPSTEWGLGYVSGGTRTQRWRLTGIVSCAAAGSVGSACAVASQARFYQLTYAASASGSGLATMTGLQECRDSTKAVCMAPTAFAWSQGKYEFATTEPATVLPTSSSSFEGFKLADVDGDGRQDMVYFKDAWDSSCGTEYMYVVYSSMSDDLNNTSDFVQSSSAICTPDELMYQGWVSEGSWHLFDYNGDGRDDLFARGAGSWVVYPSQGRSGNMNFVTGTNLIAGLSIPVMDGTTSQPQLADLNGDGLIDVVYPNGGVMRARLMERQSGGFGWGAERTVAVDMASLGPEDPECSEASNYCTRSISSVPTPKTGFLQMADFNGDAASDLLINVTNTIHYDPMLCDPYLAENASTARNSMVQTEFPESEKSEPEWAVLPYTDETGSGPSFDAVQMAPPDNCVRSATSRMIHAFGVQALTATTVGIGSYAPIVSSTVDQLRLIDANGDGLTEVAYHYSHDNHWRYMVNSGKGMTGWADLGDYGSEWAQVQFVDVNGDGRTDLLPLGTVGGDRVYQVRLAQPGGGFAAATAMPGGRAVYCGGICNVNQFAAQLADFDGDGNLDFMSIYFGTNPNLYVDRSSSRYTPRDVIAKITNGLGAQTDIVYAPMTFKDVYSRGNSSRNSLNWGRGSPVMDLLAPSYVVARAASSSPQAGAPAAKATVHYRYSGGRVQAGGRGFLGFASIDTIDPNQGNGYVATTTHYAQNFPFAGMPMQTVKKVASGATWTVPACLNGTISNACFTAPGTALPSLGGTVLSDNNQLWEMAPASLASQVPLWVRTMGTEDVLRDPFANVQTSKVVTTFGYGTYGNVASISVDTFNGADTAPMSTVITSNAYTDNASLWRLGRLTASTVTHRRPGVADVVRTSSFAYDTSGPYTGLLTVERSQSGGGARLDLRKEYTYDAFGNKTVAETCADPATACTTSINFQPATATLVQRYSKTTYDSRGRFPVSTVEPFWSGTGVVEKTTQRVVARNVFGDVTQAYNVNGADSLAVTGTMGRPYYTWSEVTPGSVPGDPAGGIESYTSYRFCGSGTNQVNCPAGAKFRQEVEAEAAPRQWTYFDVLGRPVMQGAETFNEGVIGQDVSATCTAYDTAGRPVKTSHPFFLSGTAGTSGPTSLDSVCTSSARLWTVTTYDLLGRVTEVETPDPSGTPAVVSTAYSGRTTGVSDANDNLTSSVRNGKGELTQVVDANGLATNYAYFADGTLKSVSRDAGRGAIVNSFVYDTLGRKVQQNDPDSGLTTFEYNALGELTAQVDANGNRIENEYDARSRVWRKTAKLPNGSIETQSVFEYDTAANGTGQLASETITGTYNAWAGQAGLAHSYSRSYSYDLLGRASGTTTTIDGAPYSGAVVYNALGQVWKTQDASGRWTMNHYTARGHLRAVCPSSATSTSTGCPGSTISTDPNARSALIVLKTDAWGHVVQERRGQSTALEVTRDYYAENGRAREICGGSATCGLMKEIYAWDKNGNLSVHGKEGRYAETFKYDSLNRLTHAYVTEIDGAVTNTLTHWAQYDAIGNLCAKTIGGSGTGIIYTGRAGCGVETGNGGGGTSTTGPHQLTQVQTGVGAGYFYYDAAGNQTLRDATGTAKDRTIRYTAAGQTHEALLGDAAAPGVRVRFWHGPDGQRYKQQDQTGRITYYLGNVEVIKQGTAVTYRRTVAGVQLQTINGSTVTSRYLFLDQLGSVARIANADGTVAESGDYTAFGERRSYGDPTAAGTALTATPRGYTGHEMLDSLGLVHMNARLYDAAIGRFLQPDPIVQSPGNAQSWNAYSYVLNNPMKYTDPTGMFSWDHFFLNPLSSVLRGIMSGMNSTVHGVGLFACSKIPAGWGIACAGGANYDYVRANGGSVSDARKAGLNAAFSAAVFYGIGEYFEGVSEGGQLSNAQTAAKVIAHGIAGGVVSRLNGGSFGSGFAAAGFSELAAPQIGHIGQPFAETVVAAIVGGTASKLSGGKFANGAVTAAFAYAFNRLSHDEQTIDGYSDLPKLPGGVGYFDASGNWVYTGEGWEHVVRFTGEQRIAHRTLTSSNATEVDIGDALSIPARTPATFILAEAIKAAMPSVLFGMQRGQLEMQVQVGYRHIMYHDPGGGGVVTRSPMFRHGLIWTRETYWVPYYKVPEVYRFRGRICWDCSK